MGSSGSMKKEYFWFKFAVAIMNKNTFYVPEGNSVHNYQGIMC